MKKTIPVLLAAATLAFGTLTVQAAPNAEAMVNIETHETAFRNSDVIKAGSVIQFNVGNGTATGGYRFYPEQVDIGTSRIVKEHVNLTAPEAISAPVTKNLEGRFLFSENTRNMEVIQWRFAGFSDDNYAQFYGEWIRPDYKATGHSYEDKKESRKTHENHTFGEWFVYKPSTKTFAGEQAHLCTRWFCEKSETIPLTYGTFMKDLANQVIYAADNGVVSVEHPTWASPSQEVRDALAKRPDVKLVMNGTVVAEPTAPVTGVVSPASAAAPASEAAAIADPSAAPTLESVTLQAILAMQEWQAAQASGADQAVVDAAYAKAAQAMQLFLDMQAQAQTP